MLHKRLRQVPLFRLINGNWESRLLTKLGRVGQSAHAKDFGLFRTLALQYS